MLEIAGQGTWGKPPRTLGRGVARLAEAWVYPINADTIGQRTLATRLSCHLGAKSSQVSFHSWRMGRTRNRNWTSHLLERLGRASLSILLSYDWEPLVSTSQRDLQVTTNGPQERHGFICGGAAYFGDEQDTAHGCMNANASKQMGRLVVGRSRASLPNQCTGHFLLLGSLLILDAV